MGGAVLWTNEISSGGTLTPSSEDENYPVENLYDGVAARVFRSESGSSLTILVDLGGTTGIDTLAVINHNFTSAATFSLKAGASSPPTNVVATPTYREHDLWKAFTLTSARYWQLEISDSSSDALQIGQMLLGQRVALPRARRIGEKYKPAIGRSTIRGETYGGVLWNYHLFERAILNPLFRISGDSELAVFQNLDAAVFGDLYPFLYVPDVDAAACHYVRKEAGFEPVEFELAGGGEIVREYQMTLTAESRGLDIQE